MMATTDYICIVKSVRVDWLISRRTEYPRVGVQFIYFVIRCFLQKIELRADALVGLAPDYSNK